MNLSLKYSPLNKTQIEDYLVFPIPQNTDQQQIEKPIIKTNLQFKLINEEKYNNQFIVFKLKNKTGIEIKIKLKRLIKKNKNQSRFTFIKDRFINPQDQKIKKLSQKIIGEEKEPYKQIRKIYQFTVDNLKYDKPIKGLYSYKDTLEVLEGKRSGVDCGGFSTFLVSLLQSQNIPARLVVGFLIKQSLIKKHLFNLNLLPLTFNHLSIHAWVEAQLPNNRRLSLDPSIEWRRKKGLTKRKGGFGNLPDDRIIFSYGQDFSVKISNKIYNIDILQQPIII